MARNFSGELKKRALKGEVVLATRRGIRLIEELITETDRKKAEVEKIFEGVGDDRDTLENTPLLQAQEEYRSVLSRRRKLADLAGTLQVYSETTNRRFIGFATGFEIRFEDGERVAGILVGPVEAENAERLKTRGRKLISYNSPLGSILWGQPRKNRKTIELATPSGKQRVTILK